MGIKAELLGDTGSRIFNLVLWAMAGLGITMAVNTSCTLLVDYCSIKLGDFAQEENDAFAQKENDNWIDQLPDDILCDIVSRLKATEASRTSILSRRWRKIWTMSPLMKFSYLRNGYHGYHDHVAYGDKKRFLNGVNECLQLYSGQKLKALFVHCCCFLNGLPCHLVQWMQIIARLDVEELHLGHSCPLLHGEPRKKPFTISFKLFDGHSCPFLHGEPLKKAFTFPFKLIDGLSNLRTLDLMFCYVETSFVSQCNSLVNLTLRGVPFLRQELSDILVSCPNLEILDMECCKLPQNLRITGPNLKLKILILNDCYDVKKLEISELINLVTIEIKMCTEVEILLSSVPKLHKLQLITPGMHYSFGDIQRDLLPQLEYLLIQATHQILGLPPTFRVFSNVRVLCLMTRGYPYREISEEVDLWNFASVLSACPLLEKFYLMVGGPLCKEERNVAAWPVLRHKHLEHMELAGFSNTQNELEFAKFILTSAEVLCLLVLRARTRRFDGECFYLQGKKSDKNPRYAQVVCTNLEKHALSKYAKLEIC